MSLTQFRTLIIVVNYQGYKDTIECLETVFKLESVDFCVLVVDNSDDNDSILCLTKWANESTAIIDTKFPEILFPIINKPIPFDLFREEDIKNSFIKSKLTIIRAKNRGFAAANNIGLKIGLKNGFSHFWLLNNDTVVERNSLKELLSFQLMNPNMGIIGCKLFFYNNPQMLQGVGGKYNKWIGKVSEVGNGISENKFNNEDITIDYPIGASMFTTKKFLEDVGLMDEDYFLYYEEMDWSIRAKKRGWEIGFCNNSKVFHKGGASINKGVGLGNSKLSDYYVCRNRIILAKKFFPYTLITLYPSFLKFICNRILLKQFDRILMLFKVLLNPKPHLKN